MNLTGPNGVFDMGHVLTHVLLMLILGILYYRWFHTPSPTTPLASGVPAPEALAPAFAPPTVVLPQPSPTVLEHPAPAPQMNEVDTLRKLYPPPPPSSL